MKRFIALLLALTLLAGMMPALAASDEIAIDSRNFPNRNFRKFVKNEFDRDKSGTLSQAERNRVRTINPDVASDRYEDWKFTSLKGIEFFPNLKKLCVIQRGLKRLDVSQNRNLQYLMVPDNRLTSLDVSNNTKLTYLDCERNRLTELKLGKNRKLRDFDIDGNRLASIDVGGCTLVKKIFQSHIIVEYWGSVHGWRLGYPFSVYVDRKTKIYDGSKLLYKRASVKDIAFAQQQVTLNVGDFWAPEIITTPSYAACECSFRIGNEKILECVYDEGTMRAKKAGRTTVTVVSDTGMSADIEIIVN